MIWSVLHQSHTDSHRYMAGLTLGMGLGSRKQKIRKGNEDSLRKLASQLDVRQCGKVSLEDFLDVMDEHGVRIDKDEVEDMCALADDEGKMGIVPLVSFAKGAKFWKILQKREFYDNSAGRSNSRLSKVEHISRKVGKSHSAFLHVCGQGQKWVCYEEGICESIH